jgi:hypothetical protein
MPNAAGAHPACHTEQCGLLSESDGGGGGGELDVAENQRASGSNPVLMLFCCRRAECLGEAADGSLVGHSGGDVHVAGAMPDQHHLHTLAWALNVARRPRWSSSAPWTLATHLCSRDAFRTATPGVITTCGRSASAVVQAARLCRVVPGARVCTSRCRQRQRGCHRRRQDLLGVRDRTPESTMDSSVHQSVHQLAPSRASTVLFARTRVAVSPGGVLLPGELTDS